MAKDEVQILIDGAEKHEGLPEFNDSIFCHKCDSIEHIEVSVGIAGGGFGPYTFCSMCGCVVSKSTDECE
jgi:hypothetical protein